MIHHHVDLSAPDRHRMRVSVTFDATDAGATLHLPVWTPGSYLVREYARYLGELHAVDADGAPLAVEKAAKATWRVTCDAGTTVTVSYDVTGHELTVRTPHIDGSHAFFTGTNALLRVEGAEAQPQRLTVDAPEGWHVACSLATDGDGYLATDYDVLVDGFVEAGPHTTHTFDVMGVPHTCVFWGDHMVDLQLARLEDDIRALVEANARTFDGTLPYESYLIVFHITDTARGGLEHLTGTALATPWRYFDTDEGYREMLGLISHEHFHVWNVKRIRPQALGPFDYQRENETTALWVCEGFTSYFDSLTCLRAGVWTEEQYLEALGRDLTRLANVPGRHVQSLAGASYDAWIRLYRPDEDTPNRTVSYYLKGSTVALGLDLHIRNASGGRASLGDAMRALWAGFLSTGGGFDEHRMATTISEATGVDVHDLVKRWVYGTSEPDYDALLKTHGIAVERESADGAWPGLTTITSGSDLKVKHVLDDGPNAGGPIYAGDVLVAIDGRRVTPANWSDMTKHWLPDTSRTLHLFRRGELHEVSIKAVTPPARKATLSVHPDAREDALALRERWWALPDTDA